LLDLWDAPQRVVGCIAGRGGEPARDRPRK
jgi:hypothetical protein